MEPTKQGSEGEPADDATASARLLRSDEEALERLAALVSGGTPALVIVVCAPELRDRAFHFVRASAPGVDFKEPVTTRHADEVFDLLTKAVAEGRPNEAWSLTFGKGPELVEPLQAINWHREKLLRAVSILIWLESVNDLRVFRETAPDAYSFRDMVILLRGVAQEAPRPADGDDTPLAVNLRWLARASTLMERADATNATVDALRLAGRLAEAKRLAQTMIEELLRAEFPDEAIRFRLAGSYYLLGSIAGEEGSEAEEFRWTQAALAELERIGANRTSLGHDDRAADNLLVVLLASAPGPLHKHDWTSTRRAVEIARERNLDVTLADALSTGALCIAEAGDFSEAERMLDECRRIQSSFESVVKDHALLNEFRRARVYIHAGELDKAESALQPLTRAFESLGIDSSYIQAGWARYFRERGELDTAERLLTDMTPPPDDALVFARTIGLCRVALLRGNVRGLGRILDAINQAAQQGRDGAHLELCTEVVDLLRAAHFAGRLDPDMFVRVSHEIDLAQEVSSAMTAPHTPPWYESEFLHLRRALYALQPASRAHAIDLATAALQSARKFYPDLVPRRSFDLAGQLLDDHRPEEVIRLTNDAIPLASSQGLLRNAVELAAARICALQQLTPTSSEVEQVLRAFRENLARLSPRVKCEALVWLASHLRHDPGSPDPLDLLSEAHRMYLDMQLPFDEARCLELMGDVLLARNLRKDAERRYRAALARWQHTGLFLRVPMIENKLSALRAPPADALPPRKT